MTEATESLDGEVLADFGGALRSFRLTVPQLAKVERDCDAGPAVIAGALARCVQLLEVRQGDQRVGALALLAAGLGDWKVSYIRATLFHGLRGGGMAEAEAARLIREEIDERGFMGLLERAPLAFGVITGAYVGPKDDPVGESEGAAAAAPTPTTTRARRSRTAAPASA